MHTAQATPSVARCFLRGEGCSGWDLWAHRQWKIELLCVLFRMVEISRGTISIDGVDLHSIDLHTLRSHVACIPQSPVMFVGNITWNLDPFESYSDDEIWLVLLDCRLFDVVDSRPGKLRSSVAEDGSNFSMERGSSFALPALLRKPPLLLDEATASIDAGRTCDSGYNASRIQGHNCNDDCAP